MTFLQPHPSLLQVCSRSFTSDRIGKHVEVCGQIAAKPRQVYDVALARIAGTEAHELVKEGKIQLVPAKPIAKKSDMTKMMEASRAAAGTAKPGTAAAPKAKVNKGAATAKGASGEAYQVMFDDRNQQTRNMPNKSLPTQMVRGQTGKPQDLR